KLRERGVASDKIFVTGIPVDVFNRENHDASSNVPLVLVMGGSQGIGPLEKIVDVLDDLKPPFEMAVVAGKNKRLYRRFQKRADRFKKKVEPFGYTQEVPRLMRRAALLVSKPGGLTTAEALALGLPIIFIDPIPGQEAKNAALLLKYGAALEARSAEETGALVERLFQEPRRMEAIRKQMALLARPDAALAIAQQVLDGELAF
ncbi:MAG: glycosyltransferase, partial [Candidatus Omnitrophica bacterium]|nr:glycosyltransferase [Candidatus Omnitrophota bacterium]